MVMAMQANTAAAGVAFVVLEEGGHWWATCSKLPRWSAAAGTREELQKLIEETKSLYFEGWFGAGQ